MNHYKATFDFNGTKISRFIYTETLEEVFSEVQKFYPKAVVSKIVQYAVDAPGKVHTLYKYPKEDGSGYYYSAEQIVYEKESTT